MSTMTEQASPGTPGFAPAAPPPGFTSERRLVNDVRLRYVTGGSGTPIVLLLPR
jgi:hypothetical protein